MDRAISWAWAALLAVACGGEMIPVERDGGRDGGGVIEIDGSTSVCRSDADCDDDLFCTGAERCDAESAAADARGCVLPNEAPCALEQVCNEETDHCDTECDINPDADGDGHDDVACAGDDCDDADPNRFPGNGEICDAGDHDEDCNPATYGFQDIDMDGEIDHECCNGETCGPDCDDTRPGVNTTVPEVCNGRDDDCNGAIDESGRTTYYPDADGDNYGSADPAAVTMEGCSQPPGYAANATDCDDDDARVHPGAIDTCDVAMLDEDCSGLANDPPAGCGDCVAPDTRSCVAGGLCASGMETCSAETGRWGACSIGAVPETCNGLDDNCNGTVDDGVQVFCYPDADNDGYARSDAVVTSQCPVAGRPAVGGCPVNYTNLVPLAPNDDCDDTISAISPSAIEVCDMRDNDCNGMVDDGVGVTCYVDADGDTYASMSAPAMALCPVAGRIEVGGCPIGYSNRVPAGPSSSDCNEAAVLVNPGAIDGCDGIDNDCNGVVDDGLNVLCWNDGDDDGYAPVGASSMMVCPDAARAAVGGCPLNRTNRDPEVAGQADCADSDRDIHPGAVELCDGVDNDCNGLDDVMRVTCYPDTDDDGYAAAGAASAVVCPDAARASVGYCPSRETNRAPGPGTTDCNDADPLVSPGAAETCQYPAIDGNCNGDADEGYVSGCYRDADGDTYGNPTIILSDTCPPVSGGYGACPTGYSSRAGDCNDSDAFIRPDAVETCTWPAVDQNCNGNADEGYTRSCYNDGDNDGYGSGSLISYCSGTSCGTNLATVAGDCNNGDATVYPGATETCNGRDDDCDGTVDDGFYMDRVLYRDYDGDGYYSSSARTVSVPSCAPNPSGYQSSPGTDCCDSDATTYPGAPFSAFYTTACVPRGDHNCDGIVTHFPTSVGSPCSCFSSTCRVSASGSTTECYTGTPECGAAIYVCSGCSGTCSSGCGTGTFTSGSGSDYHRCQ